MVMHTPAQLTLSSSQVAAASLTLAINLSTTSFAADLNHKPMPNLRLSILDNPSLLKVK